MWVGGVYTSGWAAGPSLILRLGQWGWGQGSWGGKQLPFCRVGRVSSETQAEPERSQKRMGLRLGQGPDVNQKGREEENQTKTRPREKECVGWHTRLSRAGNNGLPPRSATIFLCGLGLKPPFRSDRVGLGIGLGDLPTWRLQVPMTFSHFPLPHLTAQLQLLLDVQDAK